MSEPNLRTATRADGADLAVLIDIAAEGMAAYFWRQTVDDAESPVERGRERALRDDGGFSYRNAILVEQDGMTAGVLIGYPLTDDKADLADIPDLIRPLIELELEVPGYWYVNVLAVYREYRGRGLGTLLLRHADAIAQELGCKGTALIVASGNPLAKKLYARAGYREVARRKAIDYPTGRQGQEWILMTRPFD